MAAISMRIWSARRCRKIDLSKLRLIFVENIGNLICPAEFPLGSKARVVVVSVTEGPYMVRKHPHMFLGAQIVVINKIDLAAAMEVSVEDLRSRRSYAQARYQGNSRPVARPARASTKSPQRS